MKTFLKDNISVWVWMLLAIFVELFSVSFTDCKPYLTAPIYGLELLFFFLLILLLIPNRIAKIVITSILLLGQIAICVGFIYLYESNGTFFDFSMINMRSDGWAMVEDIKFNWLHLFTCVGVWAVDLGVMIGLEVYFRKHKAEKFKAGKKYNIPVAVVMSLMLVFLSVTPVYDGVIKGQNSYQNMLYNQKASKYQSKGITANAVYEIIGGSLANKVNYKDLTVVDEALTQIDDSTYTQTSEFNGISEDNNLIMLMVESWDWYPLKLYYDAETINEIFPNLTKLMGESIVLENYYTREKTDTSENNALLGSNPTGKYVNYDFEYNEYPYSLVNMFKNRYPDAVANAFHANSGSFYNRKPMFENYGFDNYYAIEEMKEYGVNSDSTSENGWKANKTKDSDTMLHMVETMFPTDKQFLTYWLTYVMHGYYDKVRENLDVSPFIDQHGVQYKGYYDYFDAKGVFPAGNGKKSDYLRTYAATLKDFDVAVGIMMDYLEENNLLDHTTIIIYADHNTYMNNLSSFGKKIDETYNSELYHIPALIYDQKLYNAYKTSVGDEGMHVVYGTDNNENYKCLTVSKFTTTIDFIPTVFDIFNIKGYRDLYPGTSVFVKDVESIIYSRAYGIFVTDKLICYSANNLLYKCEGFTDEDLDSFVARAKEHLRIKEITDKIFYSDYFSNHEYVFPPNGAVRTIVQ